MVGLRTTIRRHIIVPNGQILDLDCTFTPHQRQPLLSNNEIALNDMQCLSKDLLENELQKHLERVKSPTKVQYNERDRRLVSAYRSFVRFNLIKQKRELLLDDYIFTTLAKYLCVNPKISYDEFKVIAGVAPPCAKKYFTAQCFLKFPRDENHSISSEDFVRFIERSMEVEGAILNLMDVIAPGSDPLLTSLTEQQLEAFLMKMIPEIDVLQRMHESFCEYYVYTAAQKFLFFLDMRRTNSISIKKLAHSKEMEELLALRKLAQQAVEMGMQEVESQLNKNWFSDGNAVRLYSMFLELDKDQNGTLSMDEAAEFAGLNRRKRINFTHAAWARIFEEYIPYSPAEMDYKGFVNLLLALENPTTPASIKYFWKVLDFDRSGRLTPMKIKYFYQDVYQSLVGNYDAPSATHVVVEVFDILACNSDEGATLNDFLASKQGHVVISMLLDVNGFWRYDNRESLVGTEDDDGPEPSSSLHVEATDALDSLLLGGSGGSLGHTQVVGSVLMDDELEDIESPPNTQRSSETTSGAAGTSKGKGFVSSNKRDDDYNNDSFEQYDDEILSEEEL